MNDWLHMWACPALTLYALELWTDRRARQQPFMAAFSAAIWPVYIPIGLWVACNPKLAESLRQRFGTAAHPKAGTTERQTEPRAEPIPPSKGEAS